MTMADDPAGESLPTTPEELQLELLGGPPRWRRREVAHHVGVSVLSARKLWRALGFATVDDEDVVFTDEDAQALERAVSMVRDELLDEETTIAFTRALGQTTDRLVSWHMEALMEHLVRCPHPDCSSGSSRGAIAHLAPLLEDLERLLVYSWRRKLAAAVVRIEQPTRGSPAYSGDLTVGFADLVSYTRLSQQISQHELGVLVQRFESMAADVITAGGGRMVKTIGDEVLFTAEDAVSAAVIGLTLSERMAEDHVVPDVRVGIAHGPVLRSLGDVYGPTVNLASRLTSLAQPGTVVTDPSTAVWLAEHPALLVVAQRQRRVTGVGVILPLLVTRAMGADLRIDLD